MHDLRVVVEEIEGFCDLPMKVGDYFEISGGRIHIPPGKYICLWALQSLMPMLPVKQRKIAEENDWIPHTDRMTCPDPNGRVIYRIEVLPAGCVPTDGEDLQAAGASDDRRTPPRRMLVDPDLCSGCLRCEAACSFFHTGAFAPAKSRIYVHKAEPGEDVPRVCRQCGNAPCVAACEAGALHRDPETAAVLWDSGACTGCGVCVKGCPFDAVRMDPEDGVPLFCDLCGGEPECVGACPTGAIHYGTGDSWQRVRDRLADDEGGGSCDG